MQVIDAKQQLYFIGEIFSKITETEGLHVSTDYLTLSVNGMKQLACSGRSNVLDYGLSRGLGTQRADGSDSTKVIIGLVEYSVNFFNSDNAGNVRFINVCMYFQ